MRNIYVRKYYAWDGNTHKARMYKKYKFMCKFSGLAGSDKNMWNTNPQGTKICMKCELGWNV